MRNVKKGGIRTCPSLSVILLVSFYPVIACLLLLLQPLPIVVLIIACLLLLLQLLPVVVLIIACLLLRCSY